jgi:hypothetical protein
MCQRKQAVPPVPGSNLREPVTVSVSPTGGPSWPSLLSGDVLHTVSTMRKTLVTLMCAAAVYLSAACQPQPATPPATNTSGSAIDPADVAFGYTDSTGSKLLMLPVLDRNVPISEARAKGMASAVCSEGREFPIRYVRFQKRTPAASGRQDADSFADNEGHVSEIVQGQAAPGDTCLIVPAGYLQAFPISRNEFPKVDRDRRSGEYGQRKAVASIQKRPFDLTPFQSLSEFARQSVSRIEKEKSRTAKIYWPLHRSGASQEVAAVEFNAMGDSLLGSLVLVEPSRLSFFDMPASLRKGREDGGCWRVDDDCQFHYEALEIPAVLGEPGRQLVFFTFAGYEGQLIVLFQPREGKLAELGRNYRYLAAR